MKQQQPYLGDFFAKARSEAPVVSGDEIDALLDRADLHGRQALGKEEVSHSAESYSTIKPRRIVMGSIAVILGGAILGAGALLFNPGTPQYVSQTPVMAGAVTRAQHPATSQPALNAADKSNLIPTALIPLQEKSVDGKVGKGKEKVLTPAMPEGGDKGEVGKPDIGKELSKELQTFVENYWVDKINQYKASIDRMLTPTDLDELNRLRVRWALVDKEESPLNIMSSMNMMAVDADGNQTSVQTSIGNGQNGVSSINAEPTWQDRNGMVIQGARIQNEESNQVVVNGANGRTVSVSKNVTILKSNSEENSDGVKNDDDQVVIINTDKQINSSDQTNEDGKGKPQHVVVISTEGQENPSDLANADGNKTMIFISAEKQGNLSDQTDETVNGEHKPMMITIDQASSADDNANGNEKKMVVIQRFNKDGGETEDISEVNPAHAMVINDFDMKPMVGMIKMAISSDKNESSQIMVSAWDIADAHRPQLDELKATIISDVSTFLQQIHQKMSDFVAEHGDEVPAEMREMMNAKLDGNDLESKSSIVKSLEPFYEVVVEPMILLYNGSDINGMLTSAIAEPVAGVSLEANSTLKQSYPNPASTQTTIEYSLQEPSASTVLRVFDAKGSEVAQQNLGAQSSGAHNTTLDVSTLPAGTYLYHLTIGTAQGEKVFSKTMQVTR